MLKSFKLSKYFIIITFNEVDMACVLFLLIAYEYKRQLFKHVH